MDTTELRAAYDDLQNAADEVSSSGRSPRPAAGEWDADQILAHVALVTALTTSTACSIGSAAISTYDNRLASDLWTINRMVSFTGGGVHLRTRIALQAEALCATVSSLSESELEVFVPSLLLSNDSLLLDGPTRMRDLIAGLATTEIPGHAAQLRALETSEQLVESQRRGS